MTNAKTEAPILCPPGGKSQLITKDPDAGKDWGQEEKGATENEMIGWHHRLNGYDFDQAPGDGEGQGSLACCSPWGCKELDTTERLNNNKEGDYRNIAERHSLRKICKEGFSEEVAFELSLQTRVGVGFPIVVRLY